MKWLHSLGTIGLAVLTVLTPTIQGAISSHPTLSVVLAGIWAIFGHLLPSPVATPAP